MKKKQIIFVSGIFPPDIGGPATYINDISQYLGSIGFKVHVVTLGDKAVTYTSDNEVTVHKLRRRQNKMLRSIKLTGKIIQLCNSSTVIFANTLLLEASIAKLFTRRPIIYKIVGDYAWEYFKNKKNYLGTIDEYQKVKKSPSVRVLNFLKRGVIRNGSMVIVPSEYLRKIVFDWKYVHKSKIKVIYNSFQPAHSVGIINDKRNAVPTISTVARLVSWKGVDELIELVDEFPIKLQILGDGPEMNRLKELSSLKKNQSNIIFFGHVSNTTVYDTLSKSDLFILNSRYEGLPHVVLEAMSAGTLVIARDAGGTSEVVLHEETGFLYSDVNELKSILDHVIYKHHHFDDIRKKAKIFVEENFSKERMYRNTMESIETLYGKK